MPHLLFISKIYQASENKSKIIKTKKKFQLEWIELPNDLNHSKQKEMFFK